MPKIHSSWRSIICSPSVTAQYWSIGRLSSPDIKAQGIGAGSPQTSISAEVQILCWSVFTVNLTQFRITRKSLNKDCVDPAGMCVRERMSCVWHHSLSREVLDCVIKQSSRPACIYFSLPLTKGVPWVTVWAPPFTSIHGGQQLEIIKGINTFLLKVLSVRISYHSNRNEIRTNPL